VAAVRERERSQRRRFDDAAGPLLGRRLGVEAVEEPERLAGGVFGEQHPRQRQVVTFPRVARLLAGPQPPLAGPPGGGSRPAAGGGGAGGGGVRAGRGATGGGPRHAGTGLCKAATCGLSPTRSACPIVSSAPAVSPCAHRIRASRARPVASGWV